MSRLLHCTTIAKHKVPPAAYYIHFTSISRYQAGATERCIHFMCWIVGIKPVPRNDVYTLCAELLASSRCHGTMYTLYVLNCWHQAGATERCIHFMCWIVGRKQQQVSRIRHMAADALAMQTTRPLAVMVLQGCRGVGRKKIPDFSLTFPWLSTEIPITVEIKTLWRFFAIYSKPHRNHIIHQYMLQHSGLENRSAKENVLNIMKIVDILCKTWKQIKVRKNHLANDIWMRT